MPTAKRRPAPRHTSPISGQLRGVIRNRGLTPCSVAVLAGLAPSMMTRFVNGDRGLTPSPGLFSGHSTEP